MKKIYKLHFIFLFLLTGCSGLFITEYKLKTPNPTEYVFDVSIDSLSKKTYQSFLKKPFSKNEFKQLHVRNSSDDFSFRFCDSTIANQLNMHPYCLLLSRMDYSIGSSYLYYKAGERMSYFACFHIHFESLGAGKTRVKVDAVNPVLREGSSFRNFWVSLFGLTHGGSFDEIPVKGSTIEEYQILQRIGEIAGVFDKMPTLILPDLSNIK